MSKVGEFMMAAQIQNGVLPWNCLQFFYRNIVCLILFHTILRPTRFVMLKIGPVSVHVGIQMSFLAKTLNIY